MIFSPKNLKFEYLHRDEGNYKTFGEIILRNPTKLTSEKATALLQKSLIDGEFFEPGQVGIPLFQPDSGGYISTTDWYEFSQFTAIDQDANDQRTIEEFLRDFSLYRPKKDG